MSNSGRGEWASPVGVVLTQEDIQTAMASLAAYIDITAEDFQEIYHLAFRQAVERLSGSLRARDVMVRSVVTARPDTPLQEVTNLMARNRISGLPVVDGHQRVQGVISEHGFATHAREAGGCMVIDILPVRGEAPEAGHSLVAADIMTAPAVTLTEDTPLAEMAGSFEAWPVNRLPVTDEAGHLRGLVSRWDLANSVLAAFSAAPRNP